MAEKTTNFTAEEREAMKERAREAKLEAKRQKGEDLRAADEAEVVDKISKMAPADRAIAESETRGFVKVLTPPGSDRILGATIVGEHAGERRGGRRLRTTPVPDRQQK